MTALQETAKVLFGTYSQTVPGGFVFTPACPSTCLCCGRSCVRLYCFWVFASKRPHWAAVAAPFGPAWRSAFRSRA